MSAFVIVDVLGTSDEKKMEQYRAGVTATVQKHSGRYLAIGGPFQVKEGSWRPTFPVLLEFPNIEAANRWYDSPEYQPLKALRQAGSRCNLVLVDGLK